MQFTQKFFWLIVLGAIALGFVWPAPGLLFQPYLMYLLMVMMFLSCLKINIKDMKMALPMWWRYLVLMALIFILPTVLIFLCKSLFSPQIFIGLIIAAAVPSAVSVVFMSDLLGGEPAKALVASTLAHLVSPLVTPFLVLIFAGQTIGVDFWAMFILILKLVFIPLLLAQIVRYFKAHEFFIKKVSFLNTFLLLVLIWGIVAPAQSMVLNNLREVAVATVVVILVILAEIIISIWFGRTKKEDITWSVVDLYKNFTLSSVIALSMFGPLAVLGSVVYSIADNIMIVPLQWWAGRKKK
jgi:BASS family bile acid:Na+ symporter